MQPKMLGLMCAAAATVTAWNGARRIAALRPGTHATETDEWVEPAGEVATGLIATAEVAPRPAAAGPVATVFEAGPDPDWPAATAWVRAAAEQAVSEPQPLHPEQAVYAQISDLRERLAGDGPPARHVRRFGRRAA